MRHAQAAATATAAESSAGSLLQRQCACGNHALGGECQACQRKSLSIGAANDPLEAEADRVADQVLSQPAALSAPATVLATPVIQRKRTNDSATVDPVPAAVHDVLAASGRPLDADTRHFFEPRFGHDFSRVRVHVDDAATDAVDAQAFTVGHHVVFNASHYRPGSASGRHLLAHELTHVIQQGAVDTSTPLNGAALARKAAHALQRKPKPPYPAKVRSIEEIKKDKALTAQYTNVGQPPVARVCPSSNTDPTAKNCPDTVAAGGEVTVTKDLGGWTQLKNTGFAHLGKAPPGYMLAVFVEPNESAVPSTAKAPDAKSSAKADAADPLRQQLRRGEFEPVFKQLNGMSMESMLRQLKQFQTTDLETLSEHLESAKPLGEKSKHRMGAAIGATHMSRTGVTTAKLDSLDEVMDAADLPTDQRAFVRAILPQLPGGAATRIDSYFETQKKLGPEGAAMVGKWSTAKAFRVLKDLDQKELDDALARIAKDQLQALMLSSRQAESYGELKVEQLRQALYVAWVTRYPGERAKFDVGEAENPILKMSTGAKLAEAMSRSVGKLPGQGLERLKELLTPEAIATMVAFTAAYVVSQTTPIGWVADIIIAGLIAATVLMLGREAIEIVKLLIQFGKKASNAKSDKELDEAAELFATAVSKAGIDIILAILFHKAGKAANLKPPGPRSAGLIEVLGKGGAKIKTTLTELPQTGELVTANGASPVPISELPGNFVMMEGTAPPGRVPPRAGGAGPKATTVEGPGAKSTKPMPGRGLAAGDALTKKRPPSPRELAESGKAVTEDAAAAAEKSPSAEPAPNKAAQRAAIAEARAKAKTKTLADLDANRDRRTQILAELNEANEGRRQYLTPAERAALEAERKELIREFDLEAAEQQKLQKQLADLEISPYQKARAYSFSDAAAKDVIKRARGLDEMSGKKVQEPSIDHIVPVEEITLMDRWNNLSWSDQQAVLSRVDNLRLMEKSLNSSKGSKRWASWSEGRRQYGEAVWQSMVELEGKLRALIQGDINTRAGVKP